MISGAIRIITSNKSVAIPYAVPIKFGFTTAPIETYRDAFVIAKEIPIRIKIRTVFGAPKPSERKQEFDRSEIKIHKIVRCFEARATIDANGAIKVDKGNMLAIKDACESE